MAKERGRYVSIFDAMVDSPEFLELSPVARSVFVIGLKIVPENNRAGVFPVALETVQVRTGFPQAQVVAALTELVDREWIVRERHYVWIRNHLLYDPHFARGHRDHVKGLLDFMGTLPRLGLVSMCLSYYQSLGILPEEERLAELAPWIAKLPEATLRRRRQKATLRAPSREGGGVPGVHPGGEGDPHPAPHPPGTRIRIRNRSRSRRTDTPRAARAPVEIPGVAEEDIALVWRWWLHVMKKKPAEHQLDAKRRRTIGKAIRLTDPARCCRAIEGCFLSDWHVKNGRISVASILKDADTIEEFVQIGATKLSERGVSREALFGEGGASDEQ